ncbi:MAG: hypothetical protein K2X87_07435 [Gemmataceae bacterium]|nr:hypothetical protein [Gemmataceae bacterium]
MTRQSAKSAVMLAVVAAAIGMVVISRANHASTRTNIQAINWVVIAGLAVDPSTLEVGDVWEGGDRVVALPVRNTTANAVNITDFLTGCSCARVEPRNLVIPPYATRTVQATLDARPQHPSEVGAADRPFEKQIQPVIDSTPAGKSWVVRGTFRAPIWSGVPAVLFGESNRAGQPPVARTVPVGSRVLGTPRVFVSPAVATAELRPHDAADRWRLVVTPRTDRPAGPFRGTITIEVVPADDTSTPAKLELPLDGILREGEE